MKINLISLVFNLFWICLFRPKFLH